MLKSPQMTILLLCPCDNSVRDVPNLAMNDGNGELWGRYTTPIIIPPLSLITSASKAWSLIEAVDNTWKAMFCLMKIPTPPPLARKSHGSEKKFYPGIRIVWLCSSHVLLMAIKSKVELWRDIYPIKALEFLHRLRTLQCGIESESLFSMSWSVGQLRTTPTRCGDNSLVFAVVS